MDLPVTDKIEVIYSRLSAQNTAEANGETLQKRALPCGKKYHVFISYCNEDTAWVKETVDKLEKYHGFICCEYDRDNTPGTPLLKFADDSIHNSCKTLLVLTRNALQSEFVQHEIQMAVLQGFNEKRKCLVPLLLEDCEVPNYVNVFNYIDARDSSRKDLWWPRLIRELEIQSNNDGYIKQDAVAFTLGRITHAGSTDGSTILFDKVITFMGVSTDIQRTGVFTCPAEGIYKFQVYSLSFFNARIWLELYRNQELVASLYGYTPCDYATAGNAVILFLSKNDVVSVKAHAGLGVILYGAPGEIYTTFSGVRLTDSLVTANGNRKNISFSAVLTKHNVFHHGSTILYDKPLLNDGNGYQIDTGSFTAPRNGIYIFHFFSLAEIGSEICQELYHNSDYVCALYGLTPTDWANAGNTAILHLKLGDTAQIRARGTNKLYGQQNEIYSTFSGTLIATDYPNTPLSSSIVAFSVGLSTDTLVKQNSKVVFDRIFINLKTAYNDNTGVFTAPTDGVYEFNVHLLGLSGQMAWLELQHNHKYIISLWSNPLNHNGFASNSTLIQLDAGDVVYVKVRDKRNFILYGRRDQIFCTFSGYLCSSAFPS